MDFPPGTFKPTYVDTDSFLEIKYDRFDYWLNSQHNQQLPNVMTPSLMKPSDSFDLHIFSKIVKTTKNIVIFELTIHFDKNPAHISIINVSIRITRY